MASIPIRKIVVIVGRGQRFSLAIFDRPHRPQVADPLRSVPSDFLGARTQSIYRLHAVIFRDDGFSPVGGATMDIDPQHLSAGDLYFPNIPRSLPMPHQLKYR